MNSKLTYGIKIWSKNRKDEEEYKQEMLKNLRKQNKPKRNFVLEPVQLNNVLDDLGIPAF